MDSHERPDVVKYHNETFLPDMEKYQKEDGEMGTPGV